MSRMKLDGRVAVWIVAPFIAGGIARSAAAELSLTLELLPEPRPRESFKATDQAGVKRLEIPQGDLVSLRVTLTNNSDVESEPTVPLGGFAPIEIVAVGPGGVTRRMPELHRDACREGIPGIRPLRPRESRVVETWLYADTHTRVMGQGKERAFFFPTPGRYTVTCRYRLGNVLHTPRDQLPLLVSEPVIVEVETPFPGWEGLCEYGLIEAVGFERWPRAFESETRARHVESLVRRARRPWLRDWFGLVKAGHDARSDNPRVDVELTVSSDVRDIYLCEGLPLTVTVTNRAKALDLPIRPELFSDGTPPSPDRSAPEAFLAWLEVEDPQHDIERVFQPVLRLEWSETSAPIALHPGKSKMFEVFLGADWGERSPVPLFRPCGTYRVTARARYARKEFASEPITVSVREPPDRENAALRQFIFLAGFEFQSIYEPSATKWLADDPKPIVLERMADDDESTVYSAYARSALVAYHLHRGELAEREPDAYDRKSELSKARSLLGSLSENPPALARRKVWLAEWLVSLEPLPAPELSSP